MAAANRFPAWASPVCLIGIAFLAAIVIVDPRREFMSQDDGWAYARMVFHLLRTGEYRLDAWTAANMPVQIGIGAGFAQVFGASFTVLRLTTLLLAAAGVAAFYALLRELTVSRPVATALALALLASPLVFMLAFTFMSDVPFLAWLLIASWLYVRGLRRGDGGTLFCASLAAAAAIGTRQFGIALIAGVLAALVLPSSSPRRTLRIVLSLVVPVCAALWQWQAAQTPNHTQSFRLAEQARFMALPFASLAAEVCWRLAVMAQYVGLLALPAMPMIMALSLCKWQANAPPGRAGRRRAIVVILLTLFAVFLLAALWVGSAVTARLPESRILPLPWMLPNVFWSDPMLMRLLAVGGGVSALLLVWLMMPLDRWPRLRAIAAERLYLFMTAVALLALHVAYVQLNDTYLIGLLPFALLTVAAASRRHGVSCRIVLGTVGASAAGIVALAFFTRGDFELQEAQWKAGDRLLRAGALPRCIGGTKHWAEYHGAFDEWLAATGRSPVPFPKHGIRPETLHGPFYVWLDERHKAVRYVVLAPEMPLPPGFALREGIPYRDRWLQARSVTTAERRVSDPSEDPSCR